MYFFVYRKLSKPIIQSFMLSVLTIFLFSYFTHLLLNHSGIVDLYVFEGIEVQTIVSIAIVIFLTWFFFTKLSSAILFCFVILLSFIVFIPPLKYYNSIGLYGSWDSLMHYSFSLWIAKKGFVPHEKLGYASGYGKHPGNGLIPVFFSFITSVPLGFSMNYTLFISYLTYLVMVYTIFKIIFQPKIKNDIDILKNNFNNYIKILCMFSLLYFSPYYGGGFIVYSLVSFLVYFSTKLFIKSSYFMLREIILIIISFLGILFTHFSTALIIIFYLIVLLILSIHSTSLIMKNKKMLRYIRELSAIIFILSLFFVTYESFVGAYGMGNLPIQIIKNIISQLYQEQLEIYTEKIIVYRISLFDIIMYVISIYFKPVSLICLNLILIIIYIRDCLSWSNFEFSDNSNLIYLLFLISSSLTWLIGWFTIGNFFSGKRSVMLYQIFTIVGLFSFSKSFIRFKFFKINLILRKMSRTLVIISLFSFLVFNFVANFDLINISPFLTYKQEKYKPGSHGPISEFALMSIKYVNIYAKNATIIGILEFLGIGFRDLLWYPYIIFYSIGDTTDEAIQSLQNLAKNNKFKNSVIPLPLSYQVIPFKYGYKSFYKHSFRFLSNLSSLIYNNGYFFLFYL